MELIGLIVTNFGDAAGGWDDSGSIAARWDAALEGAGAAGPGVEGAGRATARDLVRWLRPDGSVVFGPPGRSTRRLAALERTVRREGDPRAARVVSWWRPSSRIGADLPLGDAPAATAFGDAPARAILRDDWQPRGAIVGVIHPTGGTTTAIEVAGRGVRWLGPRWTGPGLPGADPGASRLGFSTSVVGADAAEWSFAAGPVGVVRSAVLLRTPGAALLLQTESAPNRPISEARWDLGAGVEASPDPASRALILRAGRGRPTARLVPLGLPPSDYPTDRGSLAVEGREVVLRQTGDGPNRCLSLLVCWDARPPASWRPLTVAERSTAVAPGTAFAARVGFGPNRDGLLVYRDLGPGGGLRSVLGHQTRARLLVAAFEPRGTVRPWVKATGPGG